ncbi:MAG: DUF192 domain-containing protein [Spirochaetales bacterium]|jgi:uncharacterized membrane protein (UPF0127 family)|nr:DUF192 domain-containing protein [Spirochaetales bacterium]
MKFSPPFSLWLLPLFLVFTGLAGCDGTPKLKTIKLDLAGAEFTVEVADTQETRARGLMFRKSLPENAGMLFVFERDGLQHFWMENTDIPLSLAYISRTGEIREIFDMTPRSRRTVSSGFSARYALEVNQGVFEKLGIRPGYRLLIPALP